METTQCSLHTGRDTRRRLREDGAGLLALQLLVGRRSPRATSDVDDVHDLLAVIDSEEDSVDVRLAPEAQHADRSMPIGTLSGHGTAFRVRIQRQPPARDHLTTWRPAVVLALRPEGTTPRAQPPRASRSQRDMPCLRRSLAKTCGAAFVRPAFTSASPR